MRYHTSFLREVAMSTSEVEVAWNIEDIRRSLNFISDHAAEAGGTAASVTAIEYSHALAMTKSAAHVWIVFHALTTAKRELNFLRSLQNQSLDPAWREIADAHLRSASDQTQPIAATVNGSPT